MGSAAEFTDANFEEEVLKSNEPVLVDFWAPWCGPCRAIAPMVEDLAREYAGTIKIGKMNTDDSPNTPQSYGVDAIPTLMLFKGGDVVERFRGAPAKARLQQVLDAAKG